MHPLVVGESNRFESWSKSRHLLLNIVRCAVLIVREVLALALTWKIFRGVQTRD